MARRSESDQEEQYSDQSEESVQYSEEDQMEFSSENEDEANESSDPSGSESEAEDEEPEKKRLEKMKRSLAHVSFEQLAEVQSKLKNNGEDSSRNIRSVSKAQILEDLKGAAGKLKKPSRGKRRTKEDMKRDSKHSPMEVSSKKAVSRFREVVSKSTPEVRDPRFDKLSGKFNQDLFEKSYAFLNDYKKTEKEMLRERLKKEKNPEKREQLQNLLSKLISREANIEQAKRKQELIRERKKAEAELVRQGKKPYFLKRSDERKLVLMDKYEKLGEKNMDKILAKRRKKNAAKDHRRLPFKRRSEE
ncbi:hypothetical protein BX666DRAFT_1956555 [Dichotomocladium elegans]|nr:hypothetical protein BX666DRAFT_1956555 [Dichotomocladium elegans]